MRDKQIEEIFKDLCEAPIGAVKEDFTLGTMKDSHTDLCIRTIAGHLYANGYRKASDVAREILTDKILIDHLERACGAGGKLALARIKELKKEYEVK